MDKSEETVTISEKEYKQLLRQVRWLRCLEEAGVDNWEGISYAHDLHDHDVEE